MYADTPTIFLFGAVLLSFVGVLQLWLWRQDRNSVELGLWGAAHVLGGLGLALLVGRDVLPNRLSIDLANALILLGGGIAWIGARRFERQPGSIVIAAAGTVCWLIACQVPGFHNSPAHRAAGGATILGVYDALCVCAFLRQRDGSGLPSRRALAILFGIDTAMNAVRMLGALLLGSTAPTFSLPTSHWFGWPAMLGLVCIAGTSVLQIAAAKEAAEQRSNATLAQARDTANRANLAKSRFLARMSHELRTPLNGVLGMAQTLTRDPGLRGVPRERAVLLEQSGRHLLAIINDILDLASVESAQFQLAPQPTSVSDIVQGSLDLVAETAALKRMALDLAYDADVPPAMLADPLRVRQILVNLLGNAIKFTPPGGQVTLRVARLGPAGGVRLTVTDTGPGVAPAFRSHLFQDFAQRPVGTEIGGGSGLGLSISASLAEAMGGAIRYQPGPNDVGSRLVVELPLPTAEPPARLAVAPPPARPASGLRVLVVDDVASNRRLAEALLQQAGYAVVLAPDGASAIAAMQDTAIAGKEQGGRAGGDGTPGDGTPSDGAPADRVRPDGVLADGVLADGVLADGVLADGVLADGVLPDVVLMDVYMPGMDGLTASQRIRALPGRAGRVPIIAVTADASADRAPAYLEAGMNGMVTKPIDIDALVAAITAVLPHPPPAAVSQANATSPRSEPAMRPT